MRRGRVVDIEYGTCENKMREEREIVDRRMNDWLLCYILVLLLESLICECSVVCTYLLEINPRETFKAQAFLILRVKLWFACKSLISNLYVKARLLTLILDTSSLLRLEGCSTSCQLIVLWAGPSTA